ncbi:MAG: tetratricopeptide repeat protein [Phycisphaerae bacterium]
MNSPQDRQSTSSAPDGNVEHRPSNGEVVRGGEGKALLLTTAHPRWLTCVAGLLLVAITVTTYIPATRCGFIWDDDSYVEKNEVLLTPEGLSRIWLEIGATAQYYPLAYTTYWLEHRLWELDPTGYHVVNILLHALAALLLWRLLRLLQVPGAWLAAAVFALHPVHVQSVAWIAQRKNVLSGVFYFCAALAYLRYALPQTAAGWGRKSPVWYGAALLLFLCALFSKTATCTLPVILLLVLWWKRDRLAWQDVRSLSPFIVLGLAFALLTIRVETDYVRAVGQEWDRSFAERGLVAGRAFWFYIGKLVWPVQLSFVYPRWSVDSYAWQQYVYPLAAVACLVFFWIARRWLGKAPLVAVLCFAATLFPTMGFFNIYYTRYSYVADQWQYLASIFAIAFVVATIGRALHRAAARASRSLAAIAAVPLLLCLGTLSWQYQHVFHDMETLWLDTLRTNPDCWLAHNNLGNFYESQGKFDAAIDQHLRALQASTFDSDLGTSHFNFGNSLAAQGKFQEAITHYEQAIEAQPDLTAAHINLANALREQGEFVEAIRQLGLALELDPDDARTWYNAAMMLTMIGQIQPASQYLREAVRLEPDWLAPLTGLAWMLAADPDEDIRAPAEAIQLAEHAAELTRRGNAAILDLLGAAYAAAGQFDRAIETAEKALEAAVDSPESEQLAGMIRQRLDLYRQDKPFRKPTRGQEGDAP